jgi:hypothetical protein
LEAPVNMPLLDQSKPPQSLALANSAVLMALLDALIAKGVFDHAEAQDVIQQAMHLISARFRTNEAANALEVLHDLWGSFLKRGS